MYYYDYMSANPVLSGVIALIWYLLVAAGLWKTFEKAGVAGWKSLIPVYRYYLIFDIAWQGNMFWVWLLFVVLGACVMLLPGLIWLYVGYACTIVAGIMTAVLWYNVSLAYGHGFGYFLGLYFLTPIFIMIIGFSQDKYIGNRYRNI